MSDDLISRQAAIEALYNVDEYNSRSVTVIKNLPSVQPERKTGRWIAITSWNNTYKCSVCVEGFSSILRMAKTKSQRIIRIATAERI